MNLTIGNTNIGNSIKARYIASATGAVLIFSAVAGFSGALHNDANVTLRTASPASNVVSQVPSDTASIKILVVDTAAKARETENELQLMLESFAGNGLPLPARGLVVLRGSPLEQDLLGASGAWPRPESRLMSLTSTNLQSCLN